MKRQLLKRALVAQMAALAVLTIAPQVSQAATSAACGSAFSGPQLSAEAVARQSSTHASDSGEYSSTSKAREAEIAKVSKEMANEILGIGMHGDTPPMEFIAAEGVGAEYIAHSKGLNGVITKIAISGLGSSGTLKGTLLLPVSGHTGPANAKAWSKTDTYTIKMDVSKDAAGKQFDGESSSYARGSKPETVLINDAKSLDLITAHEISIQLQAGKVVRLLYFRSGSGGPSGYFEGRALDLVWDGT